MALDRIGDDSGTLAEGYKRVISFTGNAVKALMLLMGQGSTTSSVIRLRDTTAAANRLLAVVTWSAGIPTIASVAGGVSAFAPILVDDGIYLFGFQTGSVTAANNNELEIYPATDVNLAIGSQGTLYVGGVTVENATSPSGIIPTASANATRQADDLTYPAAWPLKTTETWYTRIATPYWLNLTGTLVDTYLVSRGATGSRLAIRFAAASRTIEAVVYDGTTTQLASAAIPSASGGFLDFAVQFDSLKTGARARIDTGAGYGAYSTAVTGLGSLTATLVVNDAAWTLGNEAYVDLTDLTILEGAVSYQDARATV